MTPKKAMMIVLILFLIIAIVFVFLFLQKQSADWVYEQAKIKQAELERAGTQSTSDQSAESVKILEEKVEQIIKEVKENPTDSNQTEARQIMIEVLDVIKTKETEPVDNEVLEQKAAAMESLLEQINSKNN